MPQANQIRVNPWDFQYIDLQSHNVIQTRVPATQALITFTVDCTSAGLSIVSVASVNGDSLLPTGTTQQTGSMPVPANPADGQTYVTSALTTLDNFGSFLDAQQGLFWALCSPPANGRGIPRFGFRVRSGLTYSAKTLFFTQQWKSGSWGASTPQSAPIDHGTQMQLGGWSDMQQLGATAAPCAQCLTMPVQAPHDAWNWGPVKRYPLTPTAATPAPVLVSYA